MTEVLKAPTLSPAKTDSCNPFHNRTQDRTKERKELRSSRPRHLKRSRVSRQISAVWSHQHNCAGKRPRTGWSTRLSILKKTLRDATLRLCQRLQLTLPLLNRLTWITTRSSNDRWEVAADIQTGEQYSGSMNAQKHLATTATSRKTLIVFRKIPTLLKAEASIALTCFSNVNLESRMSPKIFNSETISTTEPSITKSRNKGSTVWEWEISIPLVLLGFTNIPHLQHQLLITAKSSFNDAATDDLSRGSGMLQSKVESWAWPTSSFWSSPGRSAMYNKNNNGPRTLPCGTPDTISTLKLHTQSTLTLWVRLDKKFWNTIKIIPPTPASRNLKTRPPWWTLSKAALKSIWTSASSPPLSNSNWPAQTMSRRASQVTKLFLYEYWWDDRTPDLYKKRPTREEINFSKTFDRTGVIEIGR